MKFDNRVTRMLGVDTPIVQAPMGWIARSRLASSVSNAGALGIIETSSGELDAIRREIELMKELTDKPFGVNIAQAFVRDPSIVDFVVEQGVRFVSPSAGDPRKYTEALKAAGEFMPLTATAPRPDSLDDTVVKSGHPNGIALAQQDQRDRRGEVSSVPHLARQCPWVRTPSH